MSILRFDPHSFLTGIIGPGVLWLLIIVVGLLIGGNIIIWTLAALKYMGRRFAEGFRKGMHKSG